MYHNKVTGFWAFEVQMPYQKYQRPSILVRYQLSNACDSMLNRVTTVVIIHDNLLTLSKHIPTGKFCANIFFINYFIVLLSLQKLDAILENKMFRKFNFSKSVINKNMLLKWYCSMKKKLRKIRMFFGIENWRWKWEFWNFLWLRSSLK